MSKQLHRVGEISFVPAVCVCYCGYRIEADDPEQIPNAFQDHRAANGAERKSLSSGAYNDGTVKRLTLK